MLLTIFVTCLFVSSYIRLYQANVYASIVEVMLLPLNLTLCQYTIIYTHAFRPFDISFYINKDLAIDVDIFNIH